MKKERIVYSGRIEKSKRDILINAGMSVEKLADYWLEKTVDNQILKLTLLSKIKERDKLNSEIDDLKETLGLEGIADNEIEDKIANDKLINEYERIIGLFGTQRARKRQRKKTLTIEQYIATEQNVLIDSCNKLGMPLDELIEGLKQYYYKK